MVIMASVNGVVGIKTEWAILILNINVSFCWILLSTRLILMVIYINEALIIPVLSVSRMKKTRHLLLRGVTNAVDLCPTARVERVLQRPIITSWNEVR